MLLLLMRNFLSFFILILFFPFLLVAENVIPKKFHGTWSNDCSKEQDVFIFTESGYFNLYQSQDEIDEYTYFYLQLTDSTSYEDWISVDGDIFDFKKVFMKLETDILEIVFEDLENPDGSYDFLINTNNTLTYKNVITRKCTLLLVRGPSFMNSSISLMF
ncbi:MAG: hypothetical protein CM15mP70_13240 [Pelagibacteraceae bacterium]|nr:MAG: hypothetical protein CM15mP70_13240 [Pelagibacteraceae bacterium]